MWETVQTEMPITGTSFAVDFGSVEVGWFLFPKGAAPMMVTVPFGQPLPPQPAAVGTVKDERTGKERPNNFKQGFRLKVAGKALAGTIGAQVRELAANAGVTIEGLNELNRIEAEGAFKLHQAFAECLAAIDAASAKLREPQ